MCWTRQSVITLINNQPIILPCYMRVIPRIMIDIAQQAKQHWINVVSMSPTDFEATLGHKVALKIGSTSFQTHVLRNFNVMFHGCYFTDNDQHSPANARRWTNADLLLGQRRRRWTNIKSTVIQCLVFFRISQQAKQCWINVVSTLVRQNADIALKIKQYSYI